MALPVVCNNGVRKRSLTVGKSSEINNTGKERSRIQSYTETKKVTTQHLTWIERKQGKGILLHVFKLYKPFLRGWGANKILVH